MLIGRALVRGGEWERGVDPLLYAIYLLVWYGDEERKKVVELKNTIYLELHSKN